MARKFPLQTLFDLAQDHADAAAKNLNALKTRWNEAEEQLRQLLAYRDSYHERMRESTRSGTSVSALRDFQLFLTKLDTAIKLQQEEIERCRARWEAGREEWLRQRGKLKAYDALLVRHRRAEEKREGRAEQKELDEFAGKLERERLGDKE